MLLTILIAYVVSVFLYTIIERNNPTNKYVPGIEILPIIIDGAKGMAIGFGIVIAAVFIYTKISYFLI